MVTHSKNKVIQVQKPAQSLQAFQKKVASGEAGTQVCGGDGVGGGG